MAQLGRMGRAHGPPYPATIRHRRGTLAVPSIWLNLVDVTTEAPQFPSPAISARCSVGGATGENTGSAAGISASQGGPLHAPASSAALMSSEVPPCSPRSWSDLLPELLGRVLRFLPALDDRARFAAVCPQWRASARQLPLPPPPLPLIVFLDGTFQCLPREELFRFPVDGGYHGTCGNWLIYRRADGFLLRDPFSKATTTLPPFPNGYRARNDAKLIFCLPHLAAAAISTGDWNVSTIIAVCHPQGSSWSLACHDLGALDTHLEDIVFHKGKLYAIDDSENLLVLESDSSCTDVLRPQVTEVSCVVNGGYSCELWLQNKNTQLRYLVESCSGALLLVRRLIHDGGATVNVFMADFGQSRWTTVTTLGDNEALFLGQRSSRAVDVSQYGMLGDHIFFLDDHGCYEAEALCRYNWMTTFPLNRFSSYNMKDGKLLTPPPMFPWKHDTTIGGWFFPEALRPEAKEISAL
ncbi:hypothetical protein U9M48_014532 [Paspalum notatum var. saurae]|uniref:DUF295 domain-containing protein n=1 Tax=Paspalum notatum var. saurae TaxID=547442 RepID=A0AAQ3T1V9_PASNO